MKTYFFKGHSAIKFSLQEIRDCVDANRTLQRDFAGCGYDPDFDAGRNGFLLYLAEFFPETAKSLTRNQENICVIVFSL